MVRVVWSLLCERVLEDPTTKSATLVDVTEGLTIGGNIPELAQDAIANVPVKLSSVTLWTRESKDVNTSFESRLVVRLPDGREFGTPKFPIEMGAALNYRQVVKMQQFPFAGLGAYTLVIQAKQEDGWVAKAEVPILVQGPPETQQKKLTGKPVAPKRASRIPRKKKSSR